jgi:hypothetical protein
MGPAKKNGINRPRGRSRNKRRGKRPIGRPPFQFDLSAVEQLASLGVSVENIAQLQGCSDRTIWRHLADRDEFRQAYEKGIAHRNLRLWSNINNLSSTKAAAAIFLAKNWLGMRSEPSQTVGEHEDIEFDIPFADFDVVRAHVHATNTAPEPKPDADTDSKPV